MMFLLYKITKLHWLHPSPPLAFKLKALIRPEVAFL
jgi:hypothetical protein